MYLSDLTNSKFTILKSFHFQIVLCSFLLHSQHSKQNKQAWWGGLMKGIMKNNFKIFDNTDQMIKHLTFGVYQ